MVSDNKKTSNIAAEQHEQLEHAQRRIVQKKRLFIHFIVFLVGSLFIVIINKFLKYGAEFDWFIWAITFWAFMFVLHFMSVFVTHKFLSKDWERRQREKLVQLQKDKIAEIQKEIQTEFPLSNINKKKS